jgi:hypothetical protein
VNLLRTICAGHGGTGAAGLRPTLVGQHTLRTSAATQHACSNLPRSAQAMVVQGAPGSPLSTNDTLAALFWASMCRLRGRPLPGAAPPGARNSLGLAVDLRSNGLGAHLGDDYFGNAACAHTHDRVRLVSPSKAEVAARLQHACSKPAVA